MRNLYAENKLKNASEKYQRKIWDITPQTIRTQLNFHLHERSIKEFNQNKHSNRSSHSKNKTSHCLNFTFPDLVVPFPVVSEYVCFQGEPINEKYS